MPDQADFLNGLDRREVTTYAEANRLMEDLERVLNDLSIEIPAHCGFAEIWLHASEMESKRLGKSLIDPAGDIRPVQRRIVGLLHLAFLLIRAHRRGDTVRMKEHIRLLTKCSFAQNVKAISDEGSNKVFELLMGLAASEIGDDVDMDSPRHAQGDNPDVLFNVGGRPWAIACKVVNGVSPLTMFERIAEGVQQIEVSRADVGIVAINLKNILDHDSLWPIIAYDGNEPVYGVWPTLDLAVGKLMEFADQKHTALVSENSAEQIRKLFQAKKAVQGVLLFMQAVAGVSLRDHPVPTSLGVLSIMRFGSIADTDMVVLEAMNDILHNRFVK